MKTPSEHNEQVALCKWMDAHHVKYFAIPNGGARDAITGKRLKDEGAMAGAPDILAFLEDGTTLALEMKAREGGRVSKEQQGWLDFLGARKGWEARVCHGAKEAMETIAKFLGGKVP